MMSNAQDRERQPQRSHFSSRGDTDEPSEKRAPRLCVTPMRIGRTEFDSHRAHFSIKNTTK